MPSITKDSAVQDVSVKTVTFSFGDLNEDTVYDVMDLPPNSVILSGSFFDHRYPATADTGTTTKMTI